VLVAIGAARTAEQTTARCYDFDRPACRVLY